MKPLKNKQTAKNRQEEIKKATAAQRAQGGVSSGPTPHASKKRKYPSDIQSSGKGARRLSICLDVWEGAVDHPRYRVGKGLITSQGLVVPPPLPFLVKDKGYALDTAHSILQDADLDEYSKHKIDPLGDSGLHNMMKVSLLVRPLALESFVYIGHPFILFVSFLKAWGG